MICYIVGAGECHGLPFCPSTDDFVIAADGGLNHLEAYGITPNLIVGDFDSLCEPPPRGDNILLLPKEKDDTDMAAAIGEGWKRGFRVFRIYGGMGGRVDHTLGNIQLIADIAKRGGRGFLHGEKSVMTAIHNASITFPKTAKGLISVFSHTDTAQGVYERGLKYPLTDARLENTCPLGISNEFMGVAAEIAVEKGTLIIVTDAENMKGEA